MPSIQYCQCNTVNTILIINCKQLESFKVRAKFSSHPLQILFPIRSKFSFQCKNINKSI